MHQSDVFAVTPSAAMLARCVSRGVLTQEDIDHASSRRSPAFSSHFHEAVQRIRAQGQLDQVQLEVELLQVERQNADVTHSFHLRRRFEALQDLCCHLQQLLQDQTGLSRRLMRPLGCTNLPLQAHLHSTVVEVVQMLLVAVETLEEKVDLVQNRISSRERLSQLNGSLDRLLAQAAQVHTLSRTDP